MSHRASNVVIALVSATFVSLVACDGGLVPVGASEQKLQLRSDGSATGDGSTCSFVDPNTVVSSDGNSSPSTTVHKVGDTFKGLDGCNDCTCTAQGITCTELACGDPSTPKACTTEAKACPDGSYVGREGPNCEFAECPTLPFTGACGVDLPACPSGTDCIVVPKENKARCVANPCAYCPDPDKCVILESYPGQVNCN